jgi:hypothetical protein
MSASEYIDYCPLTSSEDRECLIMLGEYFRQVFTDNKETYLRGSEIIIGGDPNVVMHLSYDKHQELPDYHIVWFGWGEDGPKLEVLMFAWDSRNIKIVYNQDNVPVLKGHSRIFLKGTNFTRSKLPLLIEHGLKCYMNLMQQFVEQTPVDPERAFYTPQEMVRMVLRVIKGGKE